MFEQLDEPKKPPQISAAMTLGILAAYIIGAFGGVCLFIALGNRLFGIQIATAIAYTYFAFWYVFYPTRGLEERYSLQEKAVQEQIPRLLAIHFAFLLLIFIGETTLFSMKPRLPSYLFAEHGKQRDTLYEGVLIVSSVIIFFTQVLISRRILSRSLKESLKRHLL